MWAAPGGIRTQDQNDLLGRVEGLQGLDRVGPSVPMDLSIVWFEVRNLGRGDLGHPPTMFG